MTTTDLPDEAEAAGASCAPGIPCALYLAGGSAQPRRIALRDCGGRRLSDFTLIKWLPRCNDCCQAATPSEHLTLITAGSRLCRFLATPLDESFVRRLKATAVREDEGEFLVSRVLEEMPETGSRWTPRPASRRDYRAVM
jgi:hypothetical protein